MQLNEQQQKAVNLFKKETVSILTGGPGTGKSTTVRFIIESAKQMGLNNITLGSPTGKASKVLMNFTGYPASTIHRLLDPKPFSDPVTGKVKFGFGHNSENPIQTDVLILDECSMITNNLMASVLDAVTTGTKLVFVGDKGQLPSVGAGAVFRDMLESKTIPTTELTEIQRNSGDIVKACHKIIKGEFYTPSEKLEPEIGLNLKHIECSNTQVIQNIIKTIVCDRMPARGYDPVEQVQILSPVNSRTDLSCDALNRIMQDKLNPNPPIDGTIFRIGSKIINTKNENAKTPIGEEVYIINGDLGRVLDIEGNNMTVQFDDPDRKCLIPLKKNHLLLAYAVTIHRYQGSQAPVIIMPVHSAFSFFYDRSLIYTGLSRAMQICITVGEFQSIRTATMKNNSNKRITKLKSLLEG